MDCKIAAKTSELNHALFNVTHGLYVLTASSAGRLNGQCLDAMMQVTSVPPMIAIGVNIKNLILSDTKVFFECRVVPEKTIDLKTHTLFIGQVERAGVCGECEPLTYNEYRRFKMG